MKKIVKILTPIAAALAAALFFAGCKQFVADPEEFLSYWAAEVISGAYSIDKPSQTNADGALCIPSATDVTVTVKLHNPKNFTLVMPASATDAGKVINFPGLSPQPVYGTDYTLRQAGDTLKLVYKDTFLKKHEWSARNIGPEITFIADDGREFSQKFSLNLEANTPPPDIGNITIAKKQVGSNWYYALCFKVDGMNTTIGSPSVLLHKDIGAIHIQEEGSSEKIIPLTVKDDGTGFNMPSTLPEGLLSSVNPVFDMPPTGNWTVYIKTGTELAAADALPKKYKVWLTDQKGLSSPKKEAETLGCIPDLSDPTKAWKNLKTAVANAHSGGLITVTGEVKATNDDGNSDKMIVNKSITIRGRSGAVLNAQLGMSSPPLNAPTSQFRIFEVSGNNTELTLENLTLKNGFLNSTYSLGGAMYIDEIKTLTLTNCTINACKAYTGGGIFLSGGVKAILTGCTITNCEATGSSGGAIAAAELNNRHPVVYIKGSTIKDNTGHITGGAIDISKGSLYINTDENGNPDFASTETTIENNKVIASGSDGNRGGGGICYWDTTNKTLTLKIHNTKIKNCTIEAADTMADKDARGAGIYINGGKTVLLTLITLDDCKFTENSGKTLRQKQGGGIYIRNSTLTLGADTHPCTITQCKAEEGGGIYCEDSTLTIQKTKFDGNIAIFGNPSGAGLYILAKTSEVNLTINTGTEFINNNVSLIGQANGGGIYLKGNSQKSVKTTMKGGKFTLNSAQNGGGIYIDRYAEFAMKGGVLQGNTASTGNGGQGCAVYINTNGKFVWEGGTITGHTAGHVIEGPGTFTNNTNPPQTAN